MIHLLFLPNLYLSFSKLLRCWIARSSDDLKAKGNDKVILLGHKNFFLNLRTAYILMNWVNYII